MKTTKLALIFLVLTEPIALADSWPAPEPIGVASPTGSIVVRIMPGRSIGDVYGFAGQEKGEYARAEYFKLNEGGSYEKYQAVSLGNPIAPVFAFVTDFGALVTLDNWHNVGIGPVVVIYAPDGKVKKKYSLADLYPEEQLAKMSRSVSSLWWRCDDKRPFLAVSRMLNVYDTLGGWLEFDANSGSYTYHSNVHQCEDGT